MQRCRKPTVISAFFVVLFVLAGLVYPLELKYIPVMAPVITNPSLGQIDLFGQGFGAPIFIVNLSNAGDTNSYRHVYIRYTVLFEFTENGVHRTQRLYQGITDEFSVNPNEVINVSSTVFLNSKKAGGRIVLKYMEYELDDPALKDRLVVGKQLPDGILTFKLALIPNIDPVYDDNTFSHTILNSGTVELIAPGTDAGGSTDEIFNPRPLFSWTSRLYPGVYASDDVFELRIYEARRGESSREALTRPPFFSQKINSYTFQYPAEGRPFVPGYDYYWEIIGFVKGASSSEIRSNVYGFRIAPLTDSTAILGPRQIDEVLLMLRPIIGDAKIEQLRDHVSGEILIDNKPVSKAELADLIMKMVSGQYTTGEPSIQ